MFEVSIGLLPSVQTSAPFEMTPPGASTPPPAAPLATAILYFVAPLTGAQLRIVGLG